MSIKPHNKREIIKNKTNTTLLECRFPHFFNIFVYMPMLKEKSYK